MSTHAEPSRREAEPSRREKAPRRAETVLAHIGTSSDPGTGALTAPIYLSTAYAHPGLGASTGYDYTRTANPTRDVLQSALAQIEGGTAGFATSSGMAAAEVRDIAKIRLSYLTEGCNFPRVIGTHLHDGDIGIGGEA